MRTDAKADKQAKEQAQEKLRERAERESNLLISRVKEVFEAEKGPDIPKLHELAGSFKDLNLKKRLQEMVRWWRLADVGSAKFFELYKTFNELANKAEERWRPGIGCSGTYLIPDYLLQTLRTELQRASQVLLELAATV